MGSAYDEFLSVCKNGLFSENDVTSDLPEECWNVVFEQPLSMSFIEKWLWPLSKSADFDHYMWSVCTFSYLNKEFIEKHKWRLNWEALLESQPQLDREFILSHKNAIVAFVTRENYGESRLPSSKIISVLNGTF